MTPTSPGLQSTVPAALGYFAIVLGAGFVLGTLRILWLVPRLGLRTAELVEIPIMLVVIVFAARWIVRRFAVPPAARTRLAVGLLALACLIAVEFTVVLRIQGRSIRDSIVERDPVSGMAYAASLVLFALMPLLVGRLRSGRGR